MRRPMLVAVSWCVLAVAACGSAADPGDASPSELDDVEEFCAKARAFEEADPTSNVFATDDPVLIEQGWNEFDALLQDLVSTAPAEIAPDVETVATTFGLLRSAYERAGWDALAVFDVVEADPELRAVFEGSDPELDAAGDRVSSYIDEQCAASE